MARFDTSGLDGLIDDVIRMGEDGEEMGREMLMAAAEEVKSAWKAAALKHKLKDTGDMIDSIGFPKNPKKVSDVLSIDIYPQGTNRKGVRNAEVAFVNHYGTSDREGTHWVDDADEMSGPRVQEVMQRVHDEHLKKKGLID